MLPPHHVVLARREQLVGDLYEAYELVKRRYTPGYPSMIALVTGPSRTGDIERTIVLGSARAEAAHRDLLLTMGRNRRR